MYNSDLINAAYQRTCHILFDHETFTNKHVNIQNNTKERETKTSFRTLTVCKSVTCIKCTYIYTIAEPYT